MTDTQLPTEQITTARPVEPSNPFDGQLWYSDVDNILRIFDASRGVFKDISGPSDKDFFLDDGLVAHYKMDEGSISTMTDELSNHQLDRFGGVNAGSTTAVINLGRTFVGSATQFYANATDISAGGEYTVAGHFRFDGVGAGNLFLAGYTSGGIDKVFELSDDKIEFFDSLGAAIISDSFTSNILTSGSFKTIVLAVDYDGRYQIFANGALFFSGIAPTSAQGLAFGQIRIGQGLAFTVDSVSVYNDRAHSEHFSVTYHNSGGGQVFEDYPIKNVLRVTVGILAEGIEINSQRIGIVEGEDVLIDTSAPNLQDAMDNANSPSSSNTFITANDLGIKTLLSGRVSDVGGPLLTFSTVGASFSVLHPTTGEYNVTVSGLPAGEYRVDVQLHEDTGGGSGLFHQPKVTDKNSTSGFGTSSGFTILTTIQVAATGVNRDVFWSFSMTQMS